MIPSALLYYFPGRQGGGFFRAALSGVPDRMQARFLTHTRQDGSPGPDGGRGLLVTWQEGVLLQYAPASQRWQRCGDHWRGVRTDYQPEELAKASPPSQGYSILLGDGRRWVIPVALADAPNYDIPWSERLDNDGRLTRAVSPEYADVCRVARTLWERMEQNGRLHMEDDDLRRASTIALSVNYRLDLDDCLFLGLFTSESYIAIARALLDLPALEEMLRSPKAPAAPSASSGGAASSDTTVLPSPTSPLHTGKDE